MLKTFRTDSQINIQITDSGQGIPKNRLKKLFDFDFSSSGSRVKMDTGLVTAKNIVEKLAYFFKRESIHKGNISINKILLRPKQNASTGDLSQLAFPALSTKFPKTFSPILQYSLL